MTSSRDDADGGADDLHDEHGDDEHDQPEQAEARGAADDGERGHRGRVVVGRARDEAGAEAAE